MPEPTELDLIRQLGDRLGRPLEEISEERFERHDRAMTARDWSSPDRIKTDSYSLAKDGTVSGLFLNPVTSHILLDFPFGAFKNVRFLYLSQIQVSSFNFLSALTGLTSLDLSSNKISDGSFLSTLTGLTSLYLSSNKISDGSFLSKLTGLTSLYLSNNQ